MAYVLSRFLSLWELSWVLPEVPSLNPPNFKSHDVSNTLPTTVLHVIQLSLCIDSDHCRPPNLWFRPHHKAACSGLLSWGTSSLLIGTLDNSCILLKHRTNADIIDSTSSDRSEAIKTLDSHASLRSCTKFANKTLTVFYLKI